MKDLKVRDVLLFVVILLFGGMLLHLYFRKDIQVYPVPSQKTLVRTIEKQKSEIPTYITKIETDKKVINLLGTQLDSLQAELQRVKNKRDTFQIIQVQDSMIVVLFKQGMKKDTVIFNLEKVTNIQDGIIKNQDTLLRLKDLDIKRFKRQRNGAIVTSAILGTLLILK
jgi:hypothetical protein